MFFWATGLDWKLDDLCGYLDWIKLDLQLDPAGNPVWDPAINHTSAENHRLVNTIKNIQPRTYF